MAASGESVVIGQIVKPFGVRGEVRVRSLSDVPGRFEGLGQVTLVSPAGGELATVVQRVRRDGESYVVRLAAFSTPEDAAAFRGAYIKISRGSAPALPSGQYYECDLVGLRVVTEEGRVLGTLEEVVPAGDRHLFVVREGRREILIPAAKSVVTEVDLATGTMTVCSIRGLLDQEGDERHAV
jgi:16S rRNA processing protein RimM